MPQGSILGPLLFTLYINDLPDYCVNQNVTLSIFADDTSLLISGTDERDLKTNVNNTICNIMSWFNENQLIINKNKSIVVRFHHKCKKFTTLPDVKLGNVTLPIVNEVKFLGVWLDKNLDWSEHLSNLSKKLNKIGFLIGSLKSYTSLNTLKTIYFAHFHSLLSYGIIFWGHFSNCIRIFRIQKRILRLMVGIKPSVSCKSYFRSLNILTLQSVYIHEVLVQMYIQINMHQTNLQIHDHNTRNKANFHITHHRTKLFEHSFHYNGIHLYNKLPDHIKTAKTIEEFKREVRKMLLTNCFYTVNEYLNS